MPDIIYIDKDAKKNLPENPDFERYDTPVEFVTSLCNFLRDELTNFTYMRSIIDPCCGTGNWGRGIKKSKLSYGKMIGIDVQDYKQDFNLIDYQEIITSDYIYFTSERANLVIGNPPFSLAHEFIEHSLNNILYPGGYLVLLLPSRFMESKTRYDKFFGKSCSIMKPTDVIFPIQRIQYAGRGNANPKNYVVCVWKNKLFPETVITKCHWLSWR